MNQQEFYNLPEVREQLDIQKSNAYGSDAHIAAYIKIGDIAKSKGEWEKYVASGGGEY